MMFSCAQNMKILTMEFLGVNFLACSEEKKVADLDLKKKIFFKL